MVTEGTKVMSINTLVAQLVDEADKCHRAGSALSGGWAVPATVTGRNMPF